jgi:hypothetical protein
MVVCMFIVNTDRTDIQCIIAFFIMRLLARLYVRVHILHTSGRYFHDRIIYLRDEAYDHKPSLIMPLLLKSLYQARKVSEHVFVRLLLSTIFPLDFVTIQNSVVFFCFLFYYCKYLYIITNDLLSLYITCTN